MWQFHKMFFLKVPTLQPSVCLSCRSPGKGGKAGGHGQAEACTRALSLKTRAAREQVVQPCFSQALTPRAEGPWGEARPSAYSEFPREEAADPLPP